MKAGRQLDENGVFVDGEEPCNDCGKHPEECSCMPDDDDCERCGTPLSLGEILSGKMICQNCQKA
jgi:hypothetical protein